MQHLADGKQLVTTVGDDVLYNPPDGSINAALSPCTQEEADTRMLLHTADAVRQGCKKIVLRTVDIDVVALSVVAVPRLHLEHQWVAYGTDQYFKCIPAHEIAASIGRERTTCLCSMLTQDAILFHHLQQEGGSWHGRPRVHLMM